MTEMLDNFQADVEKTFGSAARHRDVIARIKKHARENPELLAMRVVDVVPERLKEVSTVGLEEFGIDLADAEAVRNYKAGSVAEWQVVSWLATYYLIYSAFLHLVGRYYRDSNLTGVRSAQAVCEAFIEAAERHLYTVALDFDELRKKLPEESFPNEELAKVLSGIVATRTSLHSNPPLRVAIDERREHSKGKSAKRERFEQLLKELPSHVLEVWEDTAHPLGNLSSLRTEVARRMGKKTQREEAAQSVLAEFELRERAREELREHDLVRQIGLSERELQVLQLDQWLDEAIGPNTQTKARIISTQLGIAPSTIRRYRKRAKDKIENYRRAAGLKT